MTSKLKMMIICIFLVCSVIILMRTYGFLEYLELAAYDFFLRKSASQNVKDDRIVIIGITDDDLAWAKKTRNSPWTLNDDLLHELFTTLLKYEPVVIGFDLYRDQDVPPGTEKLHAMFHGDQDDEPLIVTIQKMGDELTSGIGPPMYFLKNQELVSFNDVVVDPGGVIRRGLIFMKIGEEMFNSFAFMLVYHYVDPETILKQHKDDSIQFGKLRLYRMKPNDGGYINTNASGFQFMLDYQSPGSRFTTFSLKDVLTGKVSKKDLEDKLVIIGPTAVSKKDFFYTPFSQSMKAGQKTPGVMIHAQIVSQLLGCVLDGKKPMRCFSETFENLWIVLWSLLGSFVALWLGTSVFFAIVSIIVMVLLILFTYYLLTIGLWIPVVPQVLSYLITSAIILVIVSRQEKMQRGQLMQLFSKHVSQDVAEALWEKRDQFMDGNRPQPQRMMTTVLFSDLKGFTTISEKMEPGVLLDWLNEYMELMSQVIAKHNGVIDKFIGDSIMAVFGIPVARTTAESISEDAYNSVNCALDMEEALIQLNKKLEEKKFPTIKMRIGIFTGPVIAGSLGSSTRMEYTVLGDTVNTASRLESFDKSDNISYGVCRILIGVSTYMYIRGQFKTEKVGSVRLKGKDREVDIYRVSRKSE